MAEQSGIKEQLDDRRQEGRRSGQPERTQQPSLGSVPETVLALQRAAGNAAVSELLGQGAGPQPLHIQRDDTHAPAAPAKTTDLDEQAHAIIKAAQAETPGIDERAVNAVWAIIDTYYADKKSMVKEVRYKASQDGLKTTAYAGPKATGLIRVGRDFIVNIIDKHFARHVLQVGHELEHVQQHRDGKGGEEHRHEREFLAFYHEGIAAAVPHTGRVAHAMRVDMLDEAIKHYNALSDDDKKTYADQYKDLIEHRVKEQKAAGQEATDPPTNPAP
jgi:hypothetical protein